MKIEIFGYDPAIYTCAPCINAKRLTQMKIDAGMKLDVSFISIAKSKTASGKPVIDMTVGSELCKRLQRASIMGMTMPQIFVDGRSIGGFSELREFFKK
ncbi:MAG: hypothetical protein [Caudoviricetes sp.]|nr:MAG: hypothetical protein [Caudoviricetes sp.]